MLARCTPARRGSGAAHAARPTIAVYRIKPRHNWHWPARRSERTTRLLPTNNSRLAPADSRGYGAPAALAKGARCTTTRCHASSNRRDLYTPRFTFFRRMHLQPSAIFATSLRPRWCAGSARPSILSIPSTLPARRLPAIAVSVSGKATAVDDNLRSLQLGRLALPSHRSAHGASFGLRQYVATNGHPRVCAHAPSLAFFRAHTPGDDNAAFCRQKNQSRCLSLASRRAFAQRQVFHPATSRRCVRQTRPVSFISPYKSGSAKRQLMCSAPYEAYCRWSTPASAPGISCVGRGNDRVLGGRQTSRSTDRPAGAASISPAVDIGVKCLVRSTRLNQRRIEVRHGGT